MYSGGEPKFVEGDIFHVTIPLSKSATATAGPICPNSSNEVGTEADIEATTEAGTEAAIIKLDDEHLEKLLKYCNIPRTRKEMQKYCDIKT